MSYPQPDADQYALSGYKFFRLNTDIVSDGDMYQSQQGAQAFAVGPDSDIANVNLAYFDDQVDRFQNLISISPSRPFIGELLARNEGQYAPSARPGRILIWPGDLWNADWRPEDWDETRDRIDFVTPKIDVIQYFQPTTINNGHRNDKTYNFQHLPLIAADGGAHVVIPFYGRRYACVMYRNETSQDVLFKLRGIRWSYGALQGTFGSTLTQGAVIAGAQIDDVILSSTDGYFDALLATVTYPAATTGDSSLIITVSDKES